MCGIVGRRRREAQCRSHSARGPEAPRIPRIRLGRHRRRQRPARTPAQHRPRRGARASRRRGAARRPDRHRPHALGDARRALGAQRAPARLGRRSRSSTTASSRTTRRCAAACKREGYEFTSDTDTEVIAHLVHSKMAQGARLLEAVRASRRRVRPARMQSPSSTRKTRRVSSWRAWARRCCSDWAKARISPRPTPPR